MHHIQTGAPLRGACMKHADDHDRPIVNMQQLRRPEVIAAPVSPTISFTHRLILMLLSQNTAATSDMCSSCGSAHLHLFLSIQSVSEECQHVTRTGDEQGKNAQWGGFL